MSIRGKKKRKTRKRRKKGGRVGSFGEIDSARRQVSKEERPQFKNRPNIYLRSGM